MTDDERRERHREEQRRYRAAHPERARESQRRHREKYPERDRESSRRYCAKNPGGRLESRSIYRETHREQIRESARQHAWNDRWYANHPGARKAHDIVHRAILSGALVRQPCETCGALDVVAHHDDYDKPLDVRWLCISHHLIHHKSEATG